MQGETTAKIRRLTERGPEGGWILAFPRGAGFSFAERAEQIIAQAQAKAWQWIRASSHTPARHAAR